MADVNLGEAEVHGRLSAGLVQCDQEARGFGLVASLETLEAFGLGVEGVVNAFATEEETVAQRHGS